MPISRGSFVESTSSSTFASAPDSTMSPQNSPRCNEPTAFYFYMNDPLPITFMTGAETLPNAGFAFNNMNNVEFDSNNTPVPSHIGAQSVDKWVTSCSLPPSAAQECRYVPLPDTPHYSTFDYSAYTPVSWDHRYEQAAIYPGLYHPAVRRAHMPNMAALSVQSVPMPRSYSMSSASQLSSNPGSPLTSTQNRFSTALQPFVHYTDRKQTPPGSPSEHSVMSEATQLTEISPGRKRLRGKVAHYMSGSRKMNLVQCDKCDSRFGRNADLARHDRAIHRLIVHKCQSCNKTYNRSDILLRHKNQNCAEKKRRLKALL